MMNKKQKYSVIGGFLSDTIYIIHPFNNHIRFYKVYANIPNSRPIIEFLKGSDKDDDGDFRVVFTADCEIRNDKLLVRRSDFGQTWECLIQLSNIEADLNLL